MGNESGRSRQTRMKAWVFQINAEVSSLPASAMANLENPGAGAHAEVDCIVTSLPSSSGPLARAAYDLRSGLQRFEVLGQIKNLGSRQTERPLRVVGLNHRLQCWRRSVVKIRRVLP